MKSRGCSAWTLQARDVGGGEQPVFRKSGFWSLAASGHKHDMQQEPIELRRRRAIDLIDQHQRASNKRPLDRGDEAKAGNSGLLLVEVALNIISKPTAIAHSDRKDKISAAAHSPCGAGIPSFHRVGLQHGQGP